MSALRALFVNENIGGHATMHLHLREALARDSDVDASFIDVPAASGLRRLIGARVPGLAGLDLDLQPLRAQLALSAHVRRRVHQHVPDFDVIHVYSVNAGLWLTDVLRATPSVVATDSTNELNAFGLPQRSPTRWTGPMLAPTRVVERRVYEAATLVVAQSEWVADSLMHDYGVPAAKLRVIPPGVAVPALAPRRVPDGPPQITFVGTSMARKGGAQLLGVYRRALRGRAVLNLVTREGVAPEAGVRVFGDFHPGDPRLDELLAGTAVFALPSTVDKSSYAVLEAMARGVPVVTTRMAALPELVPDGVAGRLVDIDDDDELTNVLVELLDDESQRLRLGAAARARVLDRFDARVIAARTVEVLEEARVSHRSGAVIRGGTGPSRPSGRSSRAARVRPRWPWSPGAATGRGEAPDRAAQRSRSP
jgi:glycosyltransferase involved in cell wall biosynthesis